MLIAVYTIFSFSLSVSLYDIDITRITYTMIEDGNNKSIKILFFIDY